MGGDLRNVYFTNLEFDRVMFALHGNPHLTEMIALLSGKVYSPHAYSNAFRCYLQKCREQHYAMLDALRTGKRDALINLLRAHLKPSMKAYVEFYIRLFGNGSERT
jgi:DNA-binding GntR family transcriptional regulator